MVERIGAGQTADPVVVYDTMREVANLLRAHYIAQFPRDTTDPKHAAVLDRLHGIRDRLRSISPRDESQVNALREEFQHELTQDLEA